MKVSKITEPQKEKILFVSVFVACVVLGLLVIIQPHFGRVGALKGAIEDAEQRVVLIKDIEVNEKQLKVLESQIAEEKAKHVLPGQLATLAVDQGLEVLSVVPKADFSYSSHYALLGMNMQASGNFMDTMNTFKEIEALKPSVSISRFLISEKEGGGSQSASVGENRLGVSISLESLFKKR